MGGVQVVVKREREEVGMKCMGRFWERSGRERVG